MTAKDWNSSGYPVGTWRLGIKRDGTVGVYLPHTDAVDFTTEFVVAGEHLTIEGIPICPGKTGAYAWRASGDEATLTVMDDDACAARAALFGGTWHRRTG